jgi:hypothetical protein
MIVPTPTPSAKAMPPLWQYFSPGGHASLMDDENADSASASPEAESLSLSTN